jgi:hypothetical protein
MATTAKHLMINTKETDAKVPRFSLAYIGMPTEKFKMSFWFPTAVGSIVTLMIETYV